MKKNIKILWLSILFASTSLFFSFFIILLFNIDSKSFYETILMFNYAFNIFIFFGLLNEE